MQKSPSVKVLLTRLMSIYAVGIFIILWAGFVILLFVNQEFLDEIWNTIQALPIGVRIPIWLLILPIMTGLWIWESGWSTPASIAALAGMIGWTSLAVSSLVKAVRMKVD